MLDWCLRLTVMLVCGIYRCRRRLQMAWRLTSLSAPESVPYYSHCRHLPRRLLPVPWQRLRRAVWYSSSWCWSCTLTSVSGASSSSNNSWTMVSLLHHARCPTVPTWKMCWSTWPSAKRERTALVSQTAYLLWHLFIPTVGAWWLLLVCFLVYILLILVYRFSCLE